MSRGDTLREELVLDAMANCDAQALDRFTEVEKSSVWKAVARKAAAHLRAQRVARRAQAPERWAGGIYG